MYINYPDPDIVAQQYMQRVVMAKLLPKLFANWPNYPHIESTLVALCKPLQTFMNLYQKDPPPGTLVPIYLC